ncbi:hypothetical protein [Nonomuraea sp. NPDC050310]|uniref:hypothetical protein n=1 Tax=Nonomuraea sp. NPDC050310 TaxID=3154935 RepID=UPI0033F4E70E
MSKDILDEIDDVIEWHGSSDAMVWTAGRRLAPALPTISDADREAFARGLASLGEAIQEMTDAFRRATASLSSFPVVIYVEDETTAPEVDAALRAVLAEAGMAVVDEEGL